MSDAGLFAVWSRVWAVGDDGVLFKREAFDFSTRWRESSLRDAGASRLTAVWELPDERVTAADLNGNIFEWDHEWRRVPSPASTVSGIWSSANGGLWAVGAAGALLHRGPGGWTPAPSPTQAALTAIHGAEADDIWAVGTKGTVVHWNGVSWSVVPTGLSDLQLNAVRWSPLYGVVVGAHDGLVLRYRPLRLAR